MQRLLTACAMGLLLAGCQSQPPVATDVAPGSALISARHCLSEYLEDLEKNHYGPCLKIITVDGQRPPVRADGFIEIPVRTPLILGVSCVYRHADGTPIPATMETTGFAVTSSTFENPGIRWYLHAHKQARHVVGCKPTLSRSVYPTHDTD